MRYKSKISTKESLQKKLEKTVKLLRDKKEHILIQSRNIEKKVFRDEIDNITILLCQIVPL